MTQPANQTQPAFHFIDERLFHIFIDKFPREILLGPLRSDESLRNLHFPGFRISEKTPSTQQISAAYKREVVQRSNTRLATHLCKQWALLNANLVSAAFASIESLHGEKEGIDGIRKALGSDSGLSELRKLVRAVSPRFSADDVLVLISIAGQNRDPQTFREVAEQELASMNTPTEIDPDVEKDRLEDQIKIAESRLEQLKALHDQAVRDLDSKLVSAQAELDRTVGEQSANEQALSDSQSKVDSLATQVATIKAHLLKEETTSKDLRSRSGKLSKLVTHQQKEVATILAHRQTKQNQTEEERREQTTALESLRSNLEIVKERVKERQQAESLPEARDPEPAYTSEALGNNAIVYHGLQRVFRNALVRCLRERLPKVFPTDHLQRMKQLFGAQWTKEENDAARSRDTGGTTTEIRDEYDLLGINHLFNIFDKYYEDLITAEAGQPINLPRPPKVKFLGNLKTISDARNPLSHPVDEEFPFEEAHHVLVEAKHILSWLGYSRDSDVVSALTLQLNSASTETTAEADTPQVVRRLPSEDSIYQEFVGRGTVLSDLTSCFASADSRRCLLAGDGGKGKSAVAYRFAQSLSGDPGRFQLIVWLSAKRRKFEDGGAVAIDQPDFANAEQAMDRLLNEYGATPEEVAAPVAEKRRVLTEYLDTIPAFIVADDIDTVLDDDEVVSLFTYEIPHTQSAVLLTSRRAIPGIKTFVIPAFGIDEAKEFIGSRTKLYDLDPSQFSASIISDITKATDGSPLYMDDLLRSTRIVGVKKAIEIWQEKKGDEARKYALQRELEKLTEDAQKVLIAAAITDEPISFAELETILKFSEDRLYAALTELQTLFLFPKPRIVEGEQRFQINLNTKKLVRLIKSSSELYGRIERESKALSGKLPDARQGVISSLIRQAYLRLNADQPAEAETILLNAIRMYPNVADLRGFLGFAYKREGRIADARIQFDAASKLKAPKAEMFLHWIKMEISAKEWAKAAVVGEKALKSHPHFYVMRERKTYALRQGGFDLHRRFLSEKAEKLWNEAVDEIKRSIKDPQQLESGARQQNALMFETIVVCLHMLRRYRERDLWLERWESEHPDDPKVFQQKQFLAQTRARF